VGNVVTDVNNVAVVELLKSRLGSLSHPDGDPTASVLGKTSTMQPAMQEVVSKAGERLATSIVHTIETEGWTIVRNDELSDLRNKATDVDATKPVRVQCNTCNGWIFDLRLTNPQLASTSGGLLREYFRGEPADEGCRCSA
jgi:hypothetical protein